MNPKNPLYTLAHLTLAAATLAVASLELPAQTETPLNFPPSTPTQPTTDTPIPRAIPVNPTTPEPPPPNPPSTEETRRAELPSTPTQPQRTGPDVDHFNQANLLYSKREFSTAAAMYEDYLRSWPNGEDAPVVWFRMGESFLNIRDYQRAEYCYDQLIRRFQTGEMVSSAAYRLGNFTYSVGKYDLAADYFKKARINAKKPDIIQGAAYYEARSLVLLGLKTQAMENFARVAETPTGKKEYREAALRELGKLQLEQGDNAAALASFTKVIKEATDPDILAESLHYAGTINNLSNQGDDALAKFQHILNLPGVEQWKNRARSSAIQAHYTKGDYDAVIANYSQSSTILQPGNQEPLTLLTVGNAYRKKGMSTRAITVYRLVESAFPESHEALESAYYKLLCFFQEANSKLPDFVDAYLKYYKTRFPTDPFLDRAILLKAEYLFAISQNPAQYADAAAAYAQIDPAQIPEPLRPSILFKRGWTEGLAGSAAMSITTLNRFLLTYPKTPEAPLALTRRGLSRIEQYDYPGAVKDFTQVITDYPLSSSVETALQQGALVKTQMRDWDAALSAFQLLLEKFPQTKGKTEALYWIGKSYYEKQNYKLAIPHLWQALNSDPESFAEDAGLSIILCHYYGEDADGLATDIDKITASHPGVPVPPKVLWWLGVKQFQAGHYQNATRFLGLGTDPKIPDATHPQVWLHLGLARVELGWYKSAVVAAKCFLKINNLPETNAEGYLLLADAQRELHNYDNAEAAIKSGLATVKPGRTRAQLEMQAALCLLARANLTKSKNQLDAKNTFSEAGNRFQSIAQTFIDKTIQPDAMRLAAECMELAGNPEEAAKLRQDLTASHPQYKPKPPRTILPEPEILKKATEQAEQTPPHSDIPQPDNTQPAAIEAPTSPDSVDVPQPSAPASIENPSPTAPPSLDIRELEIIPRALPVEEN